MELQVDRVAVDPFSAVVISHWTPLVRLAALLTGDSGHAEDVVQDALVACLRRKVVLRDPEAALAYLRRAVVNGSRSRLRHLIVMRRHQPASDPHAPGADEGALAGVERDAVATALKALPRRQREAVVLRFYVDATEKQAAAVMGCSVGSVKGYTSRGLAALALLLEEHR